MFDESVHLDVVTLKPLAGEGETKFDMDFPVDAGSTPACRFEIAKRCLVTIKSPLYPQSAREADMSGDITLTAIVARDGTVQGITAATTVRDVKLVELAAAAVESLKTWRFERAPQPDQIRITFHYLRACQKITP